MDPALQELIETTPDGKIYSRDASDRALQASDPYAALGYHPGNFVPSGMGTHGTALMLIVLMQVMGGGL